MESRGIVYKVLALSGTSVFCNTGCTTHFGRETVRLTELRSGVLYGTIGENGTQVFKLLKLQTRDKR